MDRPNVPLASERPHKTLEELVNETIVDEEYHILIPLSDEDDQQSRTSCDKSPAPLVQCSETTKPIPTAKRAVENPRFRPATNKRKRDRPEHRQERQERPGTGGAPGNQHTCPLITVYNASFSAVLDNTRDKLPIYAVMTTFKMAALEPKKE